ncbi:End3 [Kluyveromyces lactis]|nr:End3 [Kluyveromyces lactis]
MPKLEQFEIKKYWQIFSGLKPVENKLTHDQVLPILFNSKLDTSILNKIWFLADIDDDDQLDFEEFVICMRMIFDMVNKNIDSVPDELPDWLIPGSKAELVKQRKTERSSGTTETSSVVNVPTSSPAADDYQKEVDWYISRDDKSQYESIYESAITSRDNSVSYVSLSSAVGSKYINLSSQDLEKTWRLVNPKLDTSIDKDPALYFIHILRQVNDYACPIPSHLPSALKETFTKTRVSTDLSSKQSEVRRPTLSTSNSSSYQIPKRGGTDFSVTQGTDWEVVRLQRELANIDSELSSAQQQSISHNDSNDRMKLVKQQLEQFLEYQKNLVNNSNTSSESVDVGGLRDDIESIEQQVQMLEEYLKTKKSELHNLKIEVQSLY